MSRRPRPALVDSRLLVLALFALLLGVLPGPGNGAAVSAQDVTGFTLIDATTDTAVGPLVDGAEVDLADFGPGGINVRADTEPSTVGSVVFGLDGNPSHSTENVAPYALEGDSSGDYGSWFPSLGSHTIVGTAYSGSGGSGTSGASVDVTFTVVDEGGPVNPGNLPPIADAGPARFAVSPATSVTLDGAADDTDGTVDTIVWAQVWGPPVGLSGTGVEDPVVTGLAPGDVCGFRITVTDDEGASTSDDVIVARIPAGVTPGTVSGELRTWHRVTVDFAGPSSSETANPNPFLDRRLDVVFTRGNRSFVVPGFFAADGDAAESGATSGDVWRVHFAPDEPGDWNYTALFRIGTGVAIADHPNAGSPGVVHGASGTFSVLPTDKTGRDHRGEGRLEYVGKHQLRFAGSGRYFLKGGADSPENFLAYEDFDGTYDSGGSFLHGYAPHATDWQPGDPEWGNGDGREIIGALNYLSGKGMNSVYFLTMNVQGDGRDVWPWTAHTERLRFDISKLAQWEIVFEHMDRVGLQLHVITQETENDHLLDGGALGPDRRLYYRELVARLGHHLAVVWNLGEENTNTNAQRAQFATHIRDLDPYDHPIVVHTYPGSHSSVYTPLLGYPDFEGPSLQGSFSSVHPETVAWVTASAAAGRPWIVCNDENGPATAGIVPDADDFWHDQPRKQALWGNLVGGGAGSEWYFGYSYAHDDLDCEDWRSRGHMWDLTRYALEFFQLHVPFWDMTPADSLASASSAYCLARTGDVYVVYLPNGGSTQLQVPAGTYTVEWYDPRNGGALQPGSLSSVTGPGSVALGNAPSEPGQDWAILVRGQSSTFRRGDTNGDGAVNIADAVAQLAGLFGGTPLVCLDAADTNDDGSVDISDPIATLAALFGGGTIPAPQGNCGPDPTADGLGCASGGGCP